MLYHKRIVFLSETGAGADNRNWSDNIYQGIWQGGRIGFDEVNDYGLDQNYIRWHCSMPDI